MATKNDAKDAKTQTTGADAAGAAPKAPMNKDEIKKLFAAANDAESEVDKAEKNLRDKITKRSDAVKAILDKTGNKGPYTFNGRQVTIVKRTSKENGDNYFFRGENDKEVISLD